MDGLGGSVSYCALLRRRERLPGLAPIALAAPDTVPHLLILPQRADSEVWPPRAAPAPPFQVVNRAVAEPATDQLGQVDRGVVMADHAGDGEVVIQRHGLGDGGETGGRWHDAIVPQNAWRTRGLRPGQARGDGADRGREG